MSDLQRAWKPSPRYLMRRSVVRRLLRRRGVRGKTCLEIGYGGGDTLLLYASLGMRVFGFDLSEDARAEADKRLRAAGVGPEQVTLCVSPQEICSRDYDYCMAFEVLEHVPDDVAMLRRWARYLKPGGTLMLSVPAHGRKWGAIDVWAGHIRRYERAGLRETLQLAGLEDVDILCYGFPLALALDPLLNRAYRDAAKDARGLDAASRSRQSGLRRPGRGVADRITNDTALAPFLALQTLFLRADLGSGYVATARRPAVSGARKSPGTAMAT